MKPQLSILYCPSFAALRDILFTSAVILFSLYSFVFTFGDSFLSYFEIIKQDPVHNHENTISQDKMHLKNVLALALCKCSTIVTAVNLLTVIHSINTS